MTELTADRASAVAGDLVGIGGTMSLRQGKGQQYAEWILVALGVIVYIALPHYIDGDAAVRYDTLEWLVRHAHLSNSRYPIIQELATIPLYVVGAMARSSYAFVARFNMLVFFGGLAALFMLLRGAIDVDVIRRFLLLLIAGSMFPYHTENYYGEVFAAVMVAVGLALWGRGRFRGGTVAVVAGVTNAPATIGGLALVAAHYGWRSRRWARWAIPPVLALAIILGEAWIRRGGPLVTGYAGDAGARTVLPYSSRPGFSYPIILGVLSELFSFGKGIVFFAPGLLLVLAKRERFSRTIEEFWVTSMLFLCGIILVYGKWWAWYGGWYWGPRFLLFAAFPSSLLLAYHLSSSRRSPGVRVATVAILWLSVWVAANGAVFGQNGQGICQQNNYALESLCWYVPEFSPLILPFIGHRLLGMRDVLMLAYFAAVGLCLTVPVLRGSQTDGPVRHGADVISSPPES
jgi:hypothetical protein